MESGLDRASTLKPGSGWVAADVQIANDKPFAVSVEAAKRVSTSVVLWGDAWVQPTQKRVGADVGARIHDNLDLFAGGWSSFDGSGYAAQAGVKLRF